MYASAIYIKIISINQKLMCTIYFETFVVYMHPPNLGHSLKQS